MKVHISVDMEGIAGICHEDQAEAKNMDFQRMREFMTAEVQAAVEGAKAGGATDILVCDAHDTCRNLLIERLDDDVEIIEGAPYELGMMGGISSDFDASILLGYHSMRDAHMGVIGHTYSYDFTELVINEVRIGESGLSAAIAGHFGVPVVMIAGEQLAVEEMRSLVPETLGVATKKGLGVYAARTVTPAKSRDLIRSGAKEAIVNISRVKPYSVSKPVRMEVTFTRVIMAQYVSKIPGVERTGPKSVAYVAKNMLKGFDVFETMRMVAQVSGREGAL